MSWWQDVRSDRGTQVRTAIALLVFIFWLVYAIAQFVAVGAPPLFALVLPTSIDVSSRPVVAVPFPKFSLCTIAGDNPPNLSCQFFRTNQVRSERGQRRGRLAGREAGRATGQATGIRAGGWAGGWAGDWVSD